MIDNKIVYDKDNLKESLDEFYSLYEKRPINDNHGGMTSSHLFNTWYALRKLKPKLVIESGVWKGLGTWVIEQALPEAKIISIDVRDTIDSLRRQLPAFSGRYFISKENPCLSGLCYGLCWRQTSSPILLRIL